MFDYRLLTRGWILLCDATQSSYAVEPRPKPDWRQDNSASVSCLGSIPTSHAVTVSSTIAQLIGNIHRAVKALITMFLP